MEEIENLINGFAKKCNEFLTKHNYKFSSKKILYHYTSIENFKKIIEGKRFVFTYYKNLNDTLELTYGYKVFKELLSKKDMPEIRKFEKNLEDLLLGNNFNSYISSFSEEHDNLSLWRLYGDDGYGVSIGISPEFPLLSKEKTEQPVVANVIYSEAIFRNDFNKLCERIKIIFNSQLFKKNNAKEQQKALNQLYSHLFKYCFSICLVTKHKSYSHEAEVRLLLRDGKYSHFHDYPNGFYFPKKRFLPMIRPASKRVIRFENDFSINSEYRESKKISLYSYKLETSFLKEIWLGPKVPNNTIINFENYLKKMISTYLLLK